MFLYFQISVVVFLFCVNTALSVKCYSCSSDNNPACIKPDTSKVSLVNCNMETLDETKNFAASIRQDYWSIFQVDHLHMSRNLDLSCMKLVTKVGELKHIIRGCQLAEQNFLDICHKVREKDTNNIKTTHCSRCNIDGCNSSRKITFSGLVLLIAFVTKMFVQ